MDLLSCFKMYPNGQILCNYDDCMKIHDDWTAYVAHFRSHRPQPFDCSTCNQTYPSEEHYWNHKKEGNCSKRKRLYMEVSTSIESLSSKPPVEEVASPLIHIQQVHNESDVDMENISSQQPTRGVQFSLFNNAYSFANIQTEIEKQKTKISTTR